jgi:transposase
LTIDGEGGAKIRDEIYRAERLGAKRIHEELMSTLGDDSYAVSQIKIWLQKFRNGDSSFKDSLHSGRPLLTLGPQLEAFMQKYPFASARVIAQNFLTTVPTIKDILQRELGMRKLLRCWMPHFLSPAQKRLASKHQKQYCEFYKTGNQMTLKELQRVMSSDSGIVIHLQQCLCGCHPTLFQGRDKQLARKKQ